ncbi:hypothetical protein [uncultured Nevskia sp.]|uniref:hypothetical protein n=1 Tax=uncultured Nevskia sp. TaxID=228950 RepID=UPI0025CE7847|nr:hypothetical protein [uncultured Nevskia sp.]
MTKKTETINGICEQLLFSPKGHIEGALIRIDGQTVQLNVDPGIGVELARDCGPGKPLHVLAVADQSHKTAEANHRVYKFESFANASNLGIDQIGADPDNTMIEGVVGAIHFARHGQPNGVMLQTGEFIHLRPEGMAYAELEIGSKVKAVGEVRLTMLGTRMLEAHQVNELDLE